MKKKATTHIEGDYVARDKITNHVGGDLINGNSFKNEGDISGANINVGGNNVKQTVVQHNTATDHRSLEELLQTLQQEIKQIADTDTRELAEKKYKAISEQVIKSESEWDKTLLEQSLDVLQRISESTIVILLKKILLGA